MNLIQQYKILLLTIPLLLLFTVSGHAQNIVHVVAESTDISSDPNSPSTPLIEAKKGDLFKIESYGDQWFQIRMFSGEIRYLKTDDAEIEYDFFQEQVSTSKIISQCKEVQSIQSQASEKANSKYPDNQTRADQYKNVLIDRGVLELFRNNDIPATRHSIFVDCINDSIVPIHNY